MTKRQSAVLLSAVLLLLAPAIVVSQVGAPRRSPGNIALINGQWFGGESFERKLIYSVDGRFTLKKPSRIDRTIDLNNGWIVPPFADAHSHSFGLGIPGADAKYARGYLEAGVFYVQSQGNLPMTMTEKTAVRLNTPDGVDAALSNATLTSHDSALHAFFSNMILPQGIFPGYTLETLNNVRYFEIDNEEELERKWPLILAQKNDFIKTYLWLTDDAPFVGPPPLMGKHALNPDVFKAIVSRAHAAGLRVSVHILSAGDFKVAIEGGADEIAHIPAFGNVSSEIAKLAANRGVPVVTTMAQKTGDTIPPPMREAAAAMLVGATNNLKIMAANGVPIVIGADTPTDSTIAEVAYLKSLGMFDNAAMLRMWGTATPRAIFPNRKIGAFEEGYEASFLALDANPLADWAATKRIRMRFKQGILMEPTPQ